MGYSCSERRKGPPMFEIAEHTTLVRKHAELPNGFAPVIEEFREGWSFVDSAGEPRREGKIQAPGWRLSWIAGASARGGVGQTHQEAVACALKLALRRVDESFSIAAVEHIQLTQYPWFILARVSVSSCEIQQDTLPLHSGSGEAFFLANTSSARAAASAAIAKNLD